LSVVAALRSAGGLLRRDSGQLKVGLLVLGLAREQQCNAPVRTVVRVAQLDLLDDDRAHIVLELHAPVALVLAPLADLSASF